MKNITSEIKEELLAAMDRYKSIAQKLINKLIVETNQPEKAKIREGHYDELERVDSCHLSQHMMQARCTTAK